MGSLFSCLFLLVVEPQPKGDNMQPGSYYIIFYFPENPELHVGPFKSYEGAAFMKDELTPFMNSVYGFKLNDDMDSDPVTSMIVKCFLDPILDDGVTTLSNKLDLAPPLRCVIDGEIIDDDEIPY